MATNYPGSIDSLTNPSAGDALTSPSHSAQHANANDAIEAIETELGTTPKGSAASVKARLDGIENGTRLATGAVTSAKIADGAVTSAKIADGTIATADIADAAVTYAKLGSDVRIGNLLTANQATGTGGGWYGLNATFDTTTDSGDTVGRYTLTATGVSDFANLLASTAFGVGEVRTVLVDVKSSRSQVIRLSGNGHDAGWAGVDILPARSITVAANTWTTIAVTATPATAKAYVGLVLHADAGQSGDVILVRRASIHRGAAGTFALPGTVIPGTSHIATNGAVHLSGTGSPEGVVTAAPGSIWLQTDATTDVKGWIRWIKATGTGNTGWVAGPEADTGWRDISSLMSADWALNAVIGYLRLRRAGDAIRLAGRLDRVTASGAKSGFSGVTTSALPTGFQKKNAYVVDGVAYSATSGVVIDDNSRPVVCFPDAVGTWAAGDDMFFTAQWDTADAWPASLPGSAA